MGKGGECANSAALTGVQLLWWSCQTLPGCWGVSGTLLGGGGGGGGADGADGRPEGHMLVIDAEADCCLHKAPLYSSATHLRFELKNGRALSKLSGRNLFFFFLPFCVCMRVSELKMALSRLRSVFVGKALNNTLFCGDKACGWLEKCFHSFFLFSLLILSRKFFVPKRVIIWGMWPW